MGSIPDMIRPVPAMVGSRSRLLAMHDCSGRAGALARAVINTVFPFMAGDSVMGHHAADVLVVGANPLLAAAATRRWRQLGSSVILAIDASRDSWPYDLATSVMGASLIERTLGFETVDGLAPLRRVRRIVRECLAVTDDGVSILPRGTSLSLSKATSAGEFLVHAKIHDEAPSDDAAQSGLATELRSSCAELPLLAVAPGRRPTAIFVRRIVMVSRVQGFAASRSVSSNGTTALSWPDGVSAIGSAAWDPHDGSTAARCMVDDLVRVGRLSMD